MAFVSTPLPLRHSTTLLSATTSARPKPTPTMVLGKSIKQTLVDNPKYSTLVRLANSAGLDLNLANCTVFAPDNAAFKRKPSAYLEELLQNPQKATALLRRHIVPNRVLTTKQLRGCGFWEDVWGGPLGYEGIGPIVRIGNARVVMDSSDDECDNGTIHTIDAVLKTPMVKEQGIAQTYTPSVKQFGPSSVQTLYPRAMSSREQWRGGGATLPATVGGRKAMGLVKQLPFWMYGPPYSANKQEDYEPISVAVPERAGVDYQLMPPGTVVVVPDEVAAAKLMPVSGMSRYIGKTKRLVEGDAESDYSKLPY